MKSYILRLKKSVIHIHDKNVKINDYFKTCKTVLAVHICFNIPGINFCWERYDYSF